MLPTLPAESVQCCVTSPPYWGLRDYGTATWVGGDPACNHRSRLPRATRRLGKLVGGTANIDAAEPVYRDLCAACGALRSDAQLGLEATPEQYVARMVAVFREVRRVLRKDGTLWLNLGDSYNAAGREGQGSRDGFKQGTNRASAAGDDQNRPWARDLKPKDLVGIPWRVAFALQADDWYLRSDIIWSKPNPMPESVTDRPTKAHEYLFLLSKRERYYYDARSIQEGVAPATADRYEYGFKDRYAEVTDAKGYRGPFGGKEPKWKSAHMAETPRNDGERWREAEGGVAMRGVRNKRSVWEIAIEPYPEAHFATFPTKLIKPCILAGSPEGGVVLDPFLGSGTTAMVALNLGRRAVGIELNPAYLALAYQRCQQVTLWEEMGA